MVFYSYNCPHCQILLPKLNDFQKEQKELKIVAVSLDSNREDWNNFMHKNSSNLININDPNGWDGTTASEYYIYATPTMFLLDGEKKIISKPTTYEELIKLL